MKEIPVGSQLSPEQDEVRIQFTQIIPLLRNRNLLTPTQLTELEIEHSRIFHEAHRLDIIEVLCQERDNNLAKSGIKGDAK